MACKGMRERQPYYKHVLFGSETVSLGTVASLTMSTVVHL
jgi:hypothetical protein